MSDGTLGTGEEGQGTESLWVRGRRGRGQGTDSEGGRGREAPSGEEETEKIEGFSDEERTDRVTFRDGGRGR